MREHFLTPDNYFMSHSVGCLPVRTSQDLDAGFFKPWASGQNWAEWMPVLDTFRVGLAEIIGAEKSEICPQINISSTLTKILYSLPKPTSKNVILLSKQDFPTIGFVFEQAKRQGYTVRFVEGCPTDAANWSTAITADVAVVHATHALSNTSHLLPVKDICRLARENQSVSIIDIAQSSGIVPVDVKDWGCDFAIGTGVKFLCFGPGACFLYAAEAQIVESHPIDVGWFSHENPFEMDIHHFTYAKDAMRFFGGTPSPAPFVMANTALELWNKVGLSTVSEKVQSHLNRLTNFVPEDYLISPREAGQRGGTLVIKPKDTAALTESLKRHNILHDVRDEGIRCSVHGYTSDADIKRLGDALSAVF